MCILLYIINNTVCLQNDMFIDLIHGTAGRMLLGNSIAWKHSPDEWFNYEMLDLLYFRKSFHT